MGTRGSTFTVDDHPQKDLIVQRILDGLSVRKICTALVPPVSPSAVHRYKTLILKPMVARAATVEHIVLRRNDGFVSPVPVFATQNATQLVQQAIKDAPVVSLFRRELEKYRGVINRTIEKAESAVRIVTDKAGNEVVIGADFSCIAPLINQGHKNLEMLGRATGELEPVGGSSVSIQIISGGPGEQPRVSFASREAIEAAPDDGDSGVAAIGLLQAP